LLPSLLHLLYLVNITPRTDHVVVVALPWQK
jgi:hypothetical protein